MIRKNVTIIGGGGYVGLNIASKLQRDADFQYVITVLDVAVVPLVNLSTSINYSEIKFIKGSFCDVALLEEALKDAEIVFHIAAVGVMGLSAGDRKEIYRVNIDGTAMLLEKCKEFGVKRFVFASSIAVVMVGDPLYDHSENEPLPDPRRYPTYYGYSKAAAEKLVLAASCDTFKTCALRLRAIYGAGDPNATRRVVDLIKTGMFLSRCTRNKNNREAITQASSINNVSNAFVLADKMLGKPDGPHGKAYNILDEQVTGTFEFWTPLVETLGLPKPTVFFPFWLLYFFARINEFLCFYVFKTNPILTSFELILLATDNTYSLKNAKRDLEYVPEEGNMKEVAKYYSDERDPMRWTVPEYIRLILIYFSIIFIVSFNIVAILKFIFGILRELSD